MYLPISIFSPLQSVRIYKKKLTPKGPRMHDFKTTNPIDCIVKNITEMGPNLISPESAKNITYVEQNRKKLEQNELHIRLPRKT
jgi:hypothetical protein